jgi:hypothetical protein
MSGSNNEITNSGGPVSGAEPSMEEILASIRRILKDEQSGGQTTPDDEPEDEEILVLDSSMVVKPAEALAETPAPDAESIEAKQETVLHAPIDELRQEPPAHLTSEPAEPDFPAVENETLDLPPHEAVAENLETPSFLEETRMSDDTQQNIQPPHGLVGEDASEAAISSIGSLIRSISSERSIAISRPGLTLEDLVREELRPLLKSWLDSNLPPLVERIVRAEIQRVVERIGV